MFAAAIMLCLALAQTTAIEAVTQNDLMQLQGEWIVVSEDYGIDDVKPFDLSPHQRLGWLFSTEKWTIRKNTLTLTYQQTLIGWITGYGKRNNESSITQELNGEVTVFTKKAGNPTNPFRLNPLKSPKQIDGVFDVLDPCLPAIYKLENNVLTVAIPFHFPEDMEKEPRPTRFATGETVEFGAYVVRLKRKHSSNLLGAGVHK